jgi:hypothetical protein
VTAALRSPAQALKSILKREDHHLSTRLHPNIRTDTRVEVHLVEVQATRVEDHRLAQVTRTGAMMEPQSTRVGGRLAMDQRTSLEVVAMDQRTSLEVVAMDQRTSLEVVAKERP